MPKILITHDVKDVEHWLTGNAERAASIPAGAVTDLVAADGSNRTAVLAEVDDLDAFKKYMASPPAEDAAKAESHGVLMPTLTVYYEA